MRTIRLHEAAVSEAAEAAAWYEKERPGLGTEFEQAIERALDVLEDETVPLSPVPGAARARGVKRLILRRIPFSIMVQERAAEVLVLAFAHHARRPGYWKSRVARS